MPSVALGQQPARPPAPPPPAAAPEDARARAHDLAERGRQLFESGHAEQALPLAKQAYELDPEPILLYNIARGYEQLGDLASAIESYRRFVDASPDLPAKPAIVQRIAALERVLQERAALELEYKQRLAALEERTRHETNGPIASKGPPWLGIGGVALGLGVAGMIAGASLWAVAVEQHGDAQSPTLNGMQTVTANQQAQQLSLAGNVAFPIGAFMAAAGIAAVIVGTRPPRGVDVGPGSYALAPTPGGLSLVGRF